LFLPNGEKNTYCQNYSRNNTRVIKINNVLSSNISVRIIVTVAYRTESSYCLNRSRLPLRTVPPTARCQQNTHVATPTGVYVIIDKQTGSSDAQFYDLLVLRSSNESRKRAHAPADPANPKKCPPPARIQGELIIRVFPCTSAMARAHWFVIFLKNIKTFPLEWSRCQRNTTI